MFTTHGLSRGEAVLLVLTPSHRGLLLQHLKADGVDVDGLQHARQLLLLDAAELLASFMLDGIPDATCFSMRLGEIVADMRPSSGTRKVRAFGEMVDLLWKSNQAAAIRLEQLWNDLIAGSGLSLFCAYSTSHGYDHFPEALRAAHSHLITSTVAETSNDAIVGHTLDLRIVYWNQGAERIYG
jgi:PAS domain-containing protein